MLVLPPVSGPVLRGALAAALLTEFCPIRGKGLCGTTNCPICPLLSVGEESDEHKAGTPRPFTIEPPLGSNTTFAPGDSFEFGITFFGDALPLFPYLLIALERMGASGMGDRRTAPGCFMVREVWTLEPMRGLQRRLMVEDEPTVSGPDLQIDHEAVLERTARLSCNRVSLQLLTPVRLINDGHLAHTITFDVLQRRLLRRLDRLAFATTGSGLQLPFEQLGEVAASIRVADDMTTWLDVSSHSSRTGLSTPIGGLVGRISFEGDLSLFLPWLVWGEIAHVGKDTTKGNGLYQIITR
jgi:hypothetical protein